MTTEDLEKLVAEIADELDSGSMYDATPREVILWLWDKGWRPND